MDNYLMQGDLFTEYQIPHDKSQAFLTYHTPVPLKVTRTFLLVAIFCHLRETAWQFDLPNKLFLLPTQRSSSVVSLHPYFQ